jgi:hypothetical protein
MERLRISINLAGLRPDPIIEQRVKDRSYAAMLQHFERWQAAKDMKFDDQYRAERRGLAVSYASLYNDHFSLMQRVYAEEAPITEEVLDPRLEVGVVSVLLHLAKEAGHEQSDQFRIVSDFLFSDAAYDAPANDISALLLAAVARKAASGQRRPPSPGMWNDITAIASFLPYCDAMFLDNECAGLLREEPLRTKLARFGTRIFSRRTGGAFLEYLSSLEHDAGADHVQLVADVYGEDWNVPYRQILINERERRARQSSA